MKKYTYIAVIDDDDMDFKDVEKVIKVKNLGNKSNDRIIKQVSCIQGAMSNIDECYGLCYDEILPLLEKFYNYEIINKNEMIEPYRCTILDIAYNWEVYAQNEDYSKESDELYVDGLKEELIKIANI